MRYLGFQMKLNLTGSVALYTANKHTVEITVTFERVSGTWINEHLAIYQTYDFTYKQAMLTLNRLSFGFVPRRFRSTRNVI